MHSFNLRQFTVFHNGDYSGEAEVLNQLTGEKMVIPTDVFTTLVSYMIRQERISQLEQASHAVVLGLPDRYPVFVNRPTFIESTKERSVFWAPSGTQFIDCVTQRDGWFHWDEVGQHAFGPYRTEDLAITQLHKYAEHLNEEPTTLDKG